ncbi:haloacid dehalogenase, partial [Streptomyces solincola]
MVSLPSLPLLTAGLVGPVAGGVGYGMAAGARGAAEVAGVLLGVPRRGVWWREGRCHVAAHGLHGPGGTLLAARIEEALQAHPGVEWARVNGPSERVIVAVTDAPPSERELVALVRRAGGAAGEDEAEPHHPSEGPRTRQTLPALAADSVALGMTAVRRLAPWLRLAPEVAGLAGVLHHHPALRRLAAGVSTAEQAESLLPVVHALAQGAATRGGGLVLDVVERVALWREAAAERAAWEEAEPKLVRGPEHAAADPVAAARPGPEPSDRADRYAERAMAAGLAAGALAAPFAGPRKGFAVALAALPKAPGAGREGFATSLGRALSLRGTVVMDRTVLRRIGQIDTVLLDEAALRGERYEPVDLEPVGGADPEAVAEKLFALFEADEPLRTR